jgi:hypothetical protein
MEITETVLEMHYHKPLMDLFRQTYGLAPQGRINFYKYSPQREVFIGFDQAYAITEMTDAQFFEAMRSSAMNAQYRLATRFVGYFLQYKVVTVLKKIMISTPTGITNRPHYRASLYTTKNDSTGFSQHELLFNLNRNDSAMVYYACPMVFEKYDLYEISVDLNRLRLADLDSCPSDFTDNSKHYIYFNNTATDPIWCSEPVHGRALSPNAFVELLGNYLREITPQISGEKLMAILTKLKEITYEQPSSGVTAVGPRNGLALLADALTIIRIDEPR